MNISACELSVKDMPDILDRAALRRVGHSAAQIRWLLRHAVRGTPRRPYLTSDEYATLLPDLPAGRRIRP